MMKIKNKFGTHNTSAKAGRTIKYIVIHYTAGVTSKTGSAENTAAWYLNPKCVCSSDFTVDDTEVIQYNRDIENCYTWHCGGAIYDNKGGKFRGKCTNANAIGIEVCSTNSTGSMTAPNDKSYSFTAAAVNNTVELVKYLMVKYNIPAENVIRHYDCTGKLCPGIYGWNAESGSETEWEKFKAKISGKTDNEKALLYTVQLGAFKNRDNAENLLKKAKSFSLPDAFIKIIGDMYYVQVGAFSVRSNAERMLESVKGIFPDAFIKAK